MIKDTSAQDITVAKKRNIKKPLLFTVSVLIVSALGFQALFASNDGSVSVDKASLQISEVT